MTTSARQARVNKQLTLKDAATIAGISEPFLAQVERGERQISANCAERLAIAYGVPREEIFSPSRYSVREATNKKKGA